jgi:DNA polymerase II
LNEQRGWLMDLYPAGSDGIRLWMLTDDGERLCIDLDFPITFYAAGNFQLLRQAWAYLRDKDVELSRIMRRDLFSGERDVMAITVQYPSQLSEYYRELFRRFPMLDYYDADIPLSLRFIARYGVYPLGRFRINAKKEITPLDAPWDLEPAPISLRILTLEPDRDPDQQAPQRLLIRSEKKAFKLNLRPLRVFLIGLKAVLRRINPDLILTNYGDTWLFPQLKIWSKEAGVDFNPNRDPDMEVLTRKASSYFSYGQVVYRGAQTHLFGRWHIDQRNAMLFGEYGLEGVFEQSRVTGLPVQEMARKSPGSGITAMQMLTALRTGVLVPMQKQQAEGRKSLTQLIRADRGGLIYQPLVGLHRDVAQIDFASMYPSIIVGHNISPETIGKENVPDGLVPQTLRPLLEKRLALKKKMLALNPRDCRVGRLKARSAALKWLLVVCFGYLGYKNARFGKIESHEAVTGISREIMLQGKEIAEEMGFTVLHMYVDSFFVQKKGISKENDIYPLLEAISAKTQIPILLEGVYRWVVFSASRRDKRVPVPNRYFGVFQNGEIKARGIAVRRRDTCLFVAEIQWGILEILAQADDPAEMLPKTQVYLKKQIRNLKRGKVQLEKLLVSQKLSKELDAYKTPSPAARAARQLQESGKNIAPGQSMRFVYTRGQPGVWAWDEVELLDKRRVDVERYTELVQREVETVLGAISNQQKFQFFSGTSILSRQLQFPNFAIDY